MGRVSGIVGIWVVLILGWVVVVPASAASPSDSEVARAADFRERMGFRHGTEFVRQTFSDEAYADTSWGKPLSAAENEDLDRRARLRPKLQDAIDFAEKQTSSAGVYLDQAAGGMPVFQFVDSLDGHHASIESRLPDGTEY